MSGRSVQELLKKKAGDDLYGPLSKLIDARLLSIVSRPIEGPTENSASLTSFLSLSVYKMLPMGGFSKSSE